MPESAMRQAAASLLSGRPRKGAARIPFGDDGIVPLDDRPKLAAQDAGYTSPGPVPFVCGWCRHYTPDDCSCDRVDGPYESGAVGADDTCVLWEPATDLTGGGRVPDRADESEGDVVPALLTADEYVLTGEDVDRLGGEDVLDEMRKDDD